MANISEKVEQIRKAIYGKDVRESIASGIEAINDHVETTVAAEETREANEAERIANYSAIITEYENFNEEVEQARESLAKEKEFDTLGARLEESEQDLANHETAADPHDQYALDTDLATLESALEGHELDDTAHGIGAIAQAVDNLEQEVSSHMADIAPHAETIDRTITVGVGKDFTTITAAINSIKKRVDAIIRINVDAGVYDESVTIRGFAGGGALVITGGATLEDAKNYSLRSLYAVSNNLKITFSGFTSTIETGIAFRMDYCYGFTISSCRAEKTDSTNAGFYLSGGNVLASRCIASNRSTALQAANGAIVFSSTWEAGTNNVKGIWCRSASTVGKYGTQPSGTTAEVADQGGVIR